MTDAQDALHRACEALGIATAYHEIDGRHVEVPRDTLRALVRAFGVEADDDAGLASAAWALDASRAARVVESHVRIAAQVAGETVALRLPASIAQGTLHWRIVAEDGSAHDGTCAVSSLSPTGEPAPGDAACIGRALAIPVALPPGYHRLALHGDTAPLAETTLVATPGACWQPPEIASGGRLWGPSVQLYALRSARNWGIGDFTDLVEVVRFAALRGADIVGLNPLHALFPHDPARASPYSPSSREWLNTLYVDVEAVDDVVECADAQRRLHDADFRARLAQARDGALVDYPAVAALKHEVLALAYRHFRARHLDAGSARGSAFRAFRSQRGPRLRRHAVFDALHGALRADDPSVGGWPAWPEALHDPDGDAVAAFERANAERIEYFEWLQWLAADQLSQAAQAARDAGMTVGLYTDLAVSVDGGGSDVWLDRCGYATAVSIGAPRDDFNANGQDWGLPPMRPDRLRTHGCDAFVRALRANMRDAGALRIDHVMGLMRLFWIPRGARPADGTYVGYPLETLMGIVALESHRNRCMVVGEDLGTVPDAVREAMARHGLLSCRLMVFEREWNGEFRAPHAYRRDALVSTGSHDLPTLAGWWAGRDLDVRASLGLLPESHPVDALRRDRAHARACLLRALQRDASPDAPFDASLAAAAHAYLASTPSMLMTVQVEDLLGVVEQPNLPGTVDEHPNWRRRLPVAVESLGEHAGVATIVSAIAARRGRTPDLQ